MSLFQELKRRNVFKVAVAYIVIGWVLLQVSDTLAPALLLPDWVHSTVAFLLILGFPIALVFAWAIELSPDGLRLESSQDADEDDKNPGRMYFLFVAVLVIILGYFSYYKLFGGKADSVESKSVQIQPASGDIAQTQPISPEFDRSIVVLPFVNLSSDEEQEYFSDGISEDLLNLLAKIPDLRVISRTSAFFFKGKNTTIPEVSRELNVAYVLEGSVRKAGNQVRISAKLIEADSDAQLWSQTYDRELRNMFAVQDEISLAIVNALKSRLGLGIKEAPRAGSEVGSDAYDAYLRGRHLMKQRNRSSIEGAVIEFEKSIELNPDYALAHAELAIANLLLARVRGAYGQLTENEALVRAIPHAERAVALDPDLAEAQAAIGFVRRRQGRFDEAIEHYRRAIAINPSYSDAYTWLGLLYFRSLGEYLEAIKIRERAFRLDPLSRPAILNYLGQLIAQRRLDDVRMEIEKIRTIYPDIYLRYKGNLSFVNGGISDRAIGFLEAMKLGRLTRSAQTSLSYTFMYMGLLDEALAVFNDPSPYLLSMVGRHDEAVSRAEARFAEDPTSIVEMGNLGHALAFAGDFERAEPILQNLWMKAGQRVTSTGAFQVRHVLALIIASQEPESDLKEILTATHDHIERARQAGFIEIARGHEGYIEFLAGDKDKGLALLEDSVSNGRFLRNTKVSNAVFNDPGFQRVLEIQEKRASQERAKFLELVCKDNPYAAVWQPSPGSCDRSNNQ
jgi:TolB-like protein